MANDLEVKVDTKLLERAMKQAPTRLYQRLRVNVVKHHRRFLKKFKTTRFQGGSGVKSRSRDLAKSFDVHVRGNDLDSLAVTSASSGKGSSYAPIQEEGGVITPKKSSWLTIPLRAAKTPSGVLRASARHWTDTFFTRIGGQLFLMQSKGAGKPVPLFVLVKKVTLKPRLGFLKTWVAMEGDLATEINRAAEEALAPRAVAT